jgi:hypothetical protein
MNQTQTTSELALSHDLSDQKRPSLSLAQALDQLTLLYKPGTKTLEPVLDTECNSEGAEREQAIRRESNVCDKSESFWALGILVLVNRISV